MRRAGDRVFRDTGSGIKTTRDNIRRTAFSRDDHTHCFNLFHLCKIRDVLVGNFPVNWLQNDSTISIILLSAIVTMMFGSFLRQLTTPLFLFDALGLGLFTIVGIEIGLNKGFSAGICIALGTISACFGGVLRDVLLNKVPLIFQKEIYALACIIGGTVYYFLDTTSINTDVSKVICILLIFAIRVVAVKFRLSLPRISLK